MKFQNILRDKDILQPLVQHDDWRLLDHILQHQGVLHIGYKQ